jgi:hypothetical protein
MVSSWYTKVGYSGRKTKFIGGRDGMQSVPITTNAVSLNLTQTR